MVDDGRGSSKRKAIADKKDSKNGKKRRLRTAEEAEAGSTSTGVHRQTSPFGGSNTYASLHGLKNSLHGDIYQLKLLMFFVWRGRQLGYPFRLATEMDKAEKFDDLVFQYKVEPESETVYRFLQAKHKQNETKKITVSHLLTEEDGDFSLQKYFISYSKIIKDPEFDRSALKDFIICTNIDFDIEGLKAEGIETEEVTATDDFLDFGSKYPRAKRYKFCNNQPKLNKVLETTSDAHRLAKILVEHVCKSTDIELNNDLLKRYHIALAKEVIDVENQKFSSNFIAGTNLSEREKNFREIFYEETSKRFTKLLTEDANWEEITKNPLKLCPNFGQPPELSNPRLDHLKECAEILGKLIKEADKYKLVTVDGNRYGKKAKPGSKEKFFASDIDKLAGHVLIKANKIFKFRSQFLKDDNLPGNLVEFRNLLKNKLGEIYDDLDQYRFKMPRSFKIFEEDLLHSNTELPSGEIDKEKINKFFAKLIFAVNQPNERRLDDLIANEIGDDSKFNLLNADLVGASFQKEMLDWFKEKGKEKGHEGRFYSGEDARDFFDSTVRKVENLVTSGLSLPYCEKLEEYGIEFNDGNDVLKNFLISDSGDGAKSALNVIAAQDTLPTAIRVYRAIQRSGRYKREDSLVFLRLRTLLLPNIAERVVDAFRSLDSYHLLVIDCESRREEDLQDLCRPLYRVTTQNVKKKLILITLKNESQANGSNVLLENCRETPDHVSFNHLTKKSQLKLMNRDVVNFQGQKQLTSFRKLLDISDCHNIVMRDLGRAIDTDTLVKLIKKKEIKIGNNLKGLGSVEKYYIDRKIDRLVIIKDSIRDSPLDSDVLAIGGAENMVPKSREIILKRGKETEEFKKLCEKSREKVHLLHVRSYVSGKFIWERSRGDVTFLLKYRDPSESLSSNIHYMYDSIASPLIECQLVDVDNGQRVVIVSDPAGTGKSTMLTHLAQEIKEKSPEHWVIKIDLNDFNTALEQELKRPSFDGTNSDKAFEFFYEKLSKLETKLDKEVLKRMIKKRSKVTLLFDGFDEISPDYTDMVIHLLQGLKEVGVPKLFVATRPHMRELLENELGTFSYTMKPFDENDQIQFLIKFWKAGLRSDDVEQQAEKRVEQRLKTYAKRLIKKIVESIGATAKEVVCVPVQLRMIAELFRGGEEDEGRKKTFETCKEYLRSGNDEPNLGVKLNSVDLYRSFVDRKFDIYSTEKKKDDISNLAVQNDNKGFREKFFRRHQTAALYTLFNQQEIEAIQAHMTHITEEREGAGIMTYVENGTWQFIHRTFAEYFAATFIFETLLWKADHDPNVRRFLIEKIGLEPQNDVIRAFLNGLLPEKSQRPDGRYPGDAAASEAWKADLYKYRYQGNNIFHTAAREGHYEIMKFFLNRIDQHETRKDLIIGQSDGDSRTVLGIVADNKQWKEVKWLVKNGEVEVDS